MIRHWLTRLALTSLIGAGLLAAANPANAIGLGASAGSAAQPSAQGCFAHFQNAIINANCGTQVWDVPLGMVQGGHTITVWGSNSGGGLSCFLSAINQNGTVSNSSNTVNIPGTGFIQLSATVPSNGTAFLSCSVGNGSQVNSINYSL